MPSALRLLIVEDRRDDAELLVAELVRAGFSPEWSRVDTRERLIDALRDEPQLILCDYSLPALDAIEVLTTLQQLGNDVPVIVVSGVMDEETCVKSLRHGAVDYLLKDRLARLGPAVEHALATRQLAIEARQAREKEHETASILSGLVANAPAAISVKAVDGRYLLCNLQFERLCGMEPGSLVGHTDADLFPPERAREMTERDARCLHHTMVVEQEEVFQDATGTRTFLCVRYPVVDAGGDVFGIGAIYLDITRQKRVEAELRAAREQLQARAQELGASNDQLRELDRLKTDFVASVSHELRTPLTSIRGYAEMLKDGSVDSTSGMGQRFVEIIDRNSERLLGLIEDLLILSRMDSGAYQLLDQSVSVPEIVSAVTTMLRPTLEQAGVGLDVRLGTDLPDIPGDRDQLERVLLNLLTNAVKFSSGGDTVTVSASVEGKYLRLAVQDSGIGIAPEDQRRLFTRFFRASTARERAIPGTGLGLAVVKGIVERHRGVIHVDSAPGRGTIMTVELPLSAPDGAQPSPPDPDHGRPDPPLPDPPDTA